MACGTPKSDPFDRFVLATTFANNNQTKYDSLEMTNTVCLTLLYLDQNSNCYIYKRTDKGPKFYKSVLNKQDTEEFMTLLKDLKTRFPKKYNVRPSCVQDISLISENDTLTEYKFIQTDPRTTTEFIDKIISHRSVRLTDSIETVLKYKSYIVSKVSYFNKDRYGFEPINDRYLDRHHIKFSDSLAPKK
jgi:hypothetical protein